METDLETNIVNVSAAPTGTLLSTTGKIGRAELQLIPAPAATATHRPIPHHEIVNALGEALSFRHIELVREELAQNAEVLDRRLVRFGRLFELS